MAGTQLSLLHNRSRNFMDGSNSRVGNTRAFLGELYVASKEGNVNYLEGIMDLDPEILFRIPLGTYTDTALHVAILRGHLEFIDRLLQEHPPLVRVRDADGYTPLHLAVSTGRHDIVNLLLMRGYPDDCFQQDVEGRMPIHLAVMRRHDQLLELLLNHSHPDHDRRVGTDHALRLLRQAVDCGGNIMHLCIEQSNLDALRFLVEYCRRNGEESVLNSKDKDGNTLLHLAVLLKQTETIRYLLDPAALGRRATTILNGDNRTPFQMFMQECRTKDFRSFEIMDMLMRATLAEAPHTLVIDEPARAEYKAPWYKRGIFNAFNFSPEWTRNMSVHLILVATVLYSASYQGGNHPPEKEVLTPEQQKDEKYLQTGRSLRRQYLDSAGACAMGALTIVLIFTASGANLSGNNFLMTLLIGSMLVVTLIAGYSVLEMMTLTGRSYEPTWDGGAFFYVYWTIVVIMGFLVACRVIGWTIDQVVRCFRRLRRRGN